MNLSGLPLISAADVARVMPYGAATDAIEQALRDTVDPAADPARTSVAMGAGELLLMPSHAGDFGGVKLASVAPDNPSRGLPRIQAVYVLIDTTTMTPVALVDGTALTTVRTPAVSAVAARQLAKDRIERLVVFGSGPQGGGHVEALGSIRDLGSVSIVGRDQAKAADLAARLGDRGFDATAGSADDVREADVVVCATTAETPLFDGSVLPEDACVLAIGAHLPTHRELDATLMGRSTVVIEDRATALREAGDVVLAAEDGTLDIDDTITLAALVRGEADVAAGRPAVFKGTGMSWQDLVVASAVYRALTAS